jgi:hypothetical protein
VTLVMWNLVSIHLETMLVLVQDRSMVCAKHCSEIVLDVPNGTPRSRGSSGCLFLSVLEIMLILT